MNIANEYLIRLKALWRTKAKKIIVASIPRCGSTMLWRSLAGFQPDSTTPKGIAKKINVKKHHRFTEAHKGKRYKCIFLFGNVVLSVISTQKKRMTNQHFLNCGYKGLAKDIFQEDFLNYEKIFDDWTTNRIYHTICVRYESLYENIAEIEEFLNIKLMLPPQRKRTTTLMDVEPSVLDNIRATYKTLIKKVSEAPNIKIINENLGVR